MSNAQQPPSPPRTRDDSLLGMLVSLLVGLISVTFASLLISILIEWIGMHWWWKDQGVNHSRIAAEQDLGYVAEIRRSIIVSDGLTFAANMAHYAVTPFEVSHVIPATDRLIARMEAKAALTQQGGQPQTGVMLAKLLPFVRVIPDFLIAAAYITQDAAIRLSVIVLALPAIAMASALGIVDGFGRRDIRRWSGGRESSFIYHHAKRWTGPVLASGFVLYLVWPARGFNPAWIVLPAGIAAAWSFSLMAATFKKYL